MTTVRSSTTGDPAAFLSLDALTQAFAVLPPAPADHGSVRLIVRRAADGLRETPERASLTPDGGLVGDAWGRKTKRDPKNQITVMQHDVNTLLAHGQPLTLAGDNLLVDLDLSTANLPPGSLLRVGAALVAVTPEPHDGCSKFRARFGADALRFVSAPIRRPLNLRGVHVKVIEGAEIDVGAPITVVRRGP